MEYNNQSGNNLLRCRIMVSICGTPETGKEDNKTQP